MPEGENYCPVDMIVPNFRDITDRKTGDTRSPKNSLGHAIYMSLMSKVMSGEWKRE